MKECNIAFFASFNIWKIDNNDYKVPYTHYMYLEYLCDNFSNVYLICGVKHIDSDDNKKNHTSQMSNLKVVELPEINRFISTQIYFFQYYRILKGVLPNIDIVYCRIPGPFSWMPRLVFHKRTIMHFVGDTIDATLHNEKWSKLKKYLMIAGYTPDFWLTLRAAKTSKVYTNGYHLAERLHSKGINAIAVISSTVHRNSLILPQPYKHHESIRLIYVGYIRYAKGINCLMNLCLRLKQVDSNFHFDVVGDGEMYNDVSNFIAEHNLSSNVLLHGHLDNRDTINYLLRNSDLFIFPSLSEGSPRVVIEAMSQGIPVISTPVGSLPTTFIDGQSIRFFDYNNAKQAVDIITEYTTNPAPFINQRNYAFELVKTKYTLESFLSTIFNYET